MQLALRISGILRAEEPTARRTPLYVAIGPEHRMIAATQANMFHFLDPFRCKHSHFKTEKPSAVPSKSKKKKKKSQNESTFLIKWAASAQISPHERTQLIVLDCSWIITVTIVSFAGWRLWTSPPAHGSLLPFHIDVQTLAVNCWKERLAVCIRPSVSCNNFSINQSLSLVSLFFLSFWVLCLFPPHCRSSARWLSEALKAIQVELVPFITALHRG